MKYFERERMAWIAESLRIVGYINRGHLRRKFGISPVQASIDLRKFQAAHPHAIRYNRSAKRYEATNA